MISQPDDPLSDPTVAFWFDRLADGEEIDWVAVEAQGGPALTQQLRSLARVLHSFAGAREGLQATAQPMLFQWGHLHVLSELGSGSQATVYRAFDPVLQREVALKLLRPAAPVATTNASPPDQGFVAEARKIARVRHPGVLAVHGAGVHDGRSGLWTDILSGETLRQRVTSQGVLQPNAVLALLEALADALAAVHDAGLVHGDVKAANVMLENGERPMLMDFGAAGESRSLLGGASAGTPTSLAPEVFDGEPSGTAADIYALGVLGYFLLTGRPPLDGDNLRDLQSLMPHHAQHVRVALAVLIRGALRSLLQRMLNTDPHARPSAQEVRREVAHIRDAPRRRRRAIVFSSIIAALAIATVLTTTAYFKADNAQREATANFERARRINDFLRATLAGASRGDVQPDVRVIDLLEPSVKQAELEFVDQPESLAAVLFATGDSYLALGHSREALPLFERSLALLAKTRPDPDIEAATKLRLVEALRRLDRKDEASAHLDQVEQQLGARADSLTSNAATALGADLAFARAELAQSAGEFATALPHYDRAISLREGLPDSVSNSSHLVALLGARADAHMRLGQLDQAERDEEKALALASNSLPNDASVVLTARNGLATVASQRGDSVRAEALYRENLAVLDRIGPHHFRTLSARSNLAIELLQQGKYDEAADTLLQVLEATKAGNADTAEIALFARDNLANVRRLQGRLADSVTLNRAGLAEKTTLLGPTHPATLLSEVNLAEVLVESGANEEGLRLAQHAESNLVEAFGADHPAPLEAREIIGLATLHQGDASSAKSLLSGVLSAKANVLGADSVALESTRLRLAETMDALQEAEQAQTLRREVLAAREKRLGAAHPDVQALRQRLASKD